MRRRPTETQPRPDDRSRATEGTPHGQAEGPRPVDLGHPDPGTPHAELSTGLAPKAGPGAGTLPTPNAPRRRGLR
jgi:hypothetical protein